MSEVVGTRLCCPKDQTGLPVRAYGKESGALYGEGLSLVKSCRGSIDETEKKLKILEEDGGSDGV